jgi:glycosidase
MGTFIGNHDLPRPIHLAEDAPQFDPWDGGRDRGWDNRPSLPDYAAPFERMAVAYALLMTSPGVPLVYYGDEIGMAGGGDPDNRRPMQWDGLSPHQEALRDRIAALAKIRAEHPALRRGYRSVLGETFDALVYEMTYQNDGESDRVIVALNRGDFATAAEGLPAGDYTDLISGQDVSAPVDVAGRSAMVLVPR